MRGRDDAFLTQEIMSHHESDYDINETREEAKRNIEAAQTVQKAYYDAKRKSCRKYDVGRQVVLRKNVFVNDGKSKKLLPKYSGPYVVTKVLDYGRYVIEDLPGTRRSRKRYQGICSADKLKPYIATHDSSDSGDSSSESHEHENK